MSGFTDFSFRNFITGFFRPEPKTTEINQIIIQEAASGTSGTQIFAGYYDEEFLDKLKNNERADEFDKMRRSDAQVKMLLSAVKNPIRAASREIVAASDETDHAGHAALCEQVLFRDIPFNRFVNESLTMAEYGHAVFEKVHQINIDKEITDDEGKVILSSYVGLKKLGWRSPKTIETWNFDPETKEFLGIRQCADGDLAVDVDIDTRFLMFMVLDKEGDDYEGISLLRPIFGNHFRKNHYLKLNAIGIEKSMPIPTAEVPVGLENSLQFRNLTKMLEQFTSHQKNYIIYPAGWKVELSNGTNYDPAKVEQSIDNEDRRMAKAFLANFLELGMGGGGAFALSNDLSDFFLSGLSYISGIIKEEVDALCKELVILNFGEQDKYPTFEFSGINDKAGEELAKIINLMVTSKVIIPDDDLEKHIRKRIKITPKSDEGQREAGPSLPQSGGMQFAEVKTVYGNELQEGTKVQTLIFDKSKFNKQQAIDWAKDHGFESDKVDETEESFRIRQRDPDDFERFRTIDLTSGVKAVIGPLKMANRSLSERINFAIKERNNRVL